MQAVEKKDGVFLENLRSQYPELFDKRFLYAMLQEELKITSQEIPLQLDELLKEIIQQCGVIH